MSKSTRVGVTLSPDTLASLDALCHSTGYSRAAVLQSLLLNTIPYIEEHSYRVGWFSLSSSRARHRGASGRALDLMISDALGSVNYREIQDDLLRGATLD